MKLSLISNSKAKWHWLFTLLCLAPACGGEEANEVAQKVEALAVPLPADCMPLYPPDFTKIYLTTVQGKCALGPCHSAEKKAGNLDFSNPELTYFHWVDEGRAVPGAPANSPLIARLQHENKGLRMPPGDGLVMEEICAVTQWIYFGAER